MKKILFIASVAVMTALTASQAIAQDQPAAPGISNASSAGYFLDVNMDPHLMGMANTGAAMYATAFSIWNNMASTAFSENKMDVGVSYGLWQPNGIKGNVISAAGYGRVHERITIAAGIKYFGEQPISKTTDGLNYESFTPMHLSAGVGIGVKILPILSASANVHYIMSDLGGPKKANAVSADFGAMVHLKFMNIGVTASNIGSQLNYGGIDSYGLPTNLKVGVGTTQKFGSEDKHSVTANLQGGMTFASTAFFGEVGAEYMYNDLFRVSAGYRYGDNKKDIPQYVSVGLGFKFVGISINAAYLIGLEADSPIGNTFSVGVGYSF